MTYYNQTYDPISTVQLSPFAEDQWHRLDTYSPIYARWTDMLRNNQQRTQRPTSGKLNVIDQIDINTLKLDDEILLNELNDIRKGSALLSRIKTASQELQVLNNKQEDQTLTVTDEHQQSTSSFHESKIPIKDDRSLTENSFMDLQSNPTRPISSSQSNPFQINRKNRIERYPFVNFGSKPQPALVVQLRQSAISRQNTLLATHEQRTLTPRPISAPKRSVSSAHFSRHYQQQQQQQSPPRLPSPFRHDRNLIGNIDDRASEESSPLGRKSRPKSAHSSRSTIFMVRTKIDRIREKQNGALKTSLVRPWRQASWSDDIVDAKIPNSIDMMHKICGPATPFEHSLKYNYQQHLDLFRKSSMKS